jgi:hypothetical protein
VGHKWDDTLIFFKSKTILLFVIPALPCLFLSWSIKSISSTLVRWSTGSVAESVTTILDIPFQIAKLSIIKYRKLCWGRQNGTMFLMGTFFNYAILRFKHWTFRVREIIYTNSNYSLKVAIFFSIS